MPLGDFGSKLNFFQDFSHSAFLCIGTVFSEKKSDVQLFDGKCN